MIDFLMVLACALTRMFRSKARLEAEILVLRHQLNVLRRELPKRVTCSSMDRLVFAGLYHLAPGVLDAIKIPLAASCPVLTSGACIINTSGFDFR